MYANENYEIFDVIPLIKQKILAYIESANNLLNDALIHEKESQDSIIMNNQLKKCLKETYTAVHKNKNKKK